MTLKFNSLRARFIIAIFLWTALGISAIWYSSISIFESHVEAQYHEELDVHVQELDGLTKLDPSGKPYLARPLSDPRFSVPMAGFYWQITRDGHQPVRSPSFKKGKLDDSVAQSASVKHRIATGPTGKAIIYGLTRKTAQGDDLRFVIATDQRLLDKIINDFERELILWLAVLALLLLASGGAIIWYGLRPLEYLGQAIASLRSGKSNSIEGHYPSEIDPLVHDLNAYVKSNDALIMGARSQAAKLAHALRTPLAVMTDEAERIKLDNPDSKAAETFLEQCRLMTQQTEYQLARSRFAIGQMRPSGSCKPKEVIAPLINAMRRLHPQKKFSLNFIANDQIRVGIDEMTVREMAGCVLDNAGKWASTSIDCQIYTSENQIILEVKDDGPGMTAEEAAEAFEIGSRFDKNKPGFGLGLAIAKEIAQDVGGEILIVSDDKSAGGLLVRIAMPLVGDNGNKS
jgi:signal transduction histidine kinase